MTQVHGANCKSMYRSERQLYITAVNFFFVPVASVLILGGCNKFGQLVSHPS
jgi:hypothetical protein